VGAGPSRAEFLVEQQPGVAQHTAYRMEHPREGVLENDCMIADA
jgi:hypothetical protein